MGIKCTICNSSSLRRFIIGEDWSIYRCKYCTNAFTYPAPSLPDYEQQDFHDVEQSEDKLKYYKNLPYDWKQLIEIQLEFVKTHIPDKGAILEIGCGEGLLLYELNKNNYDLTGLEASHSACKRGRKKGLNIKQGYFEKTNFDKQFDCIIMSQVLEHVKDLDSFIEKLTKISPSGYLILTQTNFKGLIPMMKKANWYAWVPEQHYWHFTIKGLKNVLKKHRFSYINSQYSSLVHSHNYLYKLAKLKANWQDQFTVLFKHN